MNRRGKDIEFKVIALLKQGKVAEAIKKAEEQLSKYGKLYCLGDIVHNNLEVERLKLLGLITIDYDEFKKLHDCAVLIRAHGEPPETYKIAKDNNIMLLDATCPVVLRLQHKIKLGNEEMFSQNGQVVIYGKNGHAEVNGLVGQTEGKAVVVGNIISHEVAYIHPHGRAVENVARNPPIPAIISKSRIFIRQFLEIYFRFVIRH